MSEEMLTLDDLAKLKKQREEEKSKLPYKAYLDDLKSLVYENNPKLSSSIKEPKANNNQYVCIREPLEFINLFNACNGQDECKELFQKLLDERNSRVVDQIINEREDINGLWFNTTQNGINLRPGLRDEEWSSPTTITLGDDAVHSLVAGRTGSGKSVFLNSIIFSLLAEYSPWELDLYLVDFKKVEFSRYLSKYNVPHIKAVAATSEIRYVLSLLNYLAACMIARQNFFALIGQQKLSEVREKYQIVLPRVLLIVDEFQQLFLEATGKEEMQIAEVLTSITKLGRATGFHLMFASQEMSGTMSQSVFSNFKARFALACDAEVSSRVLGNSGAANLNKKGLVLANVGAGKEETNQLFKVPFVSEEYFYEYLQNITELGIKVNYNSVHKFYQEDSIKGMDELSNVLDAIKDVRAEYLKKNSSLFEIVTLGEAVVFNYRKYDYETVFLERGVRKNIGVFSPVVDDTVYVCKLLAENFNSSPKAEKYQHYILARNDLFMKKMDLGRELNVSNSRVYNSTGFLDEIIGLFKRRSREAALFEQLFSEYDTMLHEFGVDVEEKKKRLAALTVIKKREGRQEIAEASLEFAKTAAFATLGIKKKRDVVDAGIGVIAKISKNLDELDELKFAKPKKSLARKVIKGIAEYSDVMKLDDETVEKAETVAGTDLETPTFEKLVVATLAKVKGTKELDEWKKSGKLDVVIATLKTTESLKKTVNAIGQGPYAIIKNIPDLGTNVLDLVEKTAKYMVKNDVHMKPKAVDKVLHKLGRELIEYENEVEQYKIDKERKKLAAKKPKAPPFVVAKEFFKELKKEVDRWDEISAPIKNGSQSEGGSRAW